MLGFVRVICAHADASRREREASDSDISARRQCEAELVVGDQQKRSAKTEMRHSGVLDLAFLLLPTTMPYNPSLPANVAAPHCRSTAPGDQ